MVRIFTLNQGMNEQALEVALLDARFSGPRAEAAMQTLKAANPHLDFGKLKRGTAIVVPNISAFKASATESKAVTPIAEYGDMVRSGLALASKEIQRSTALRKAERAKITAIFKSAPFKKNMDASEDLAKRTAEALQLMLDEEVQDKDDEKSFLKLEESAILALDQLTKLFG